jgi:hypothetical protein
MKKLIALLLLSPLAFAFENDVLSDKEIQASKEFKATIANSFIIDALDSLDKCANYHGALLLVMKSWLEPSIDVFQGYTNDEISKRMIDYTVLTMEIRKELTWSKNQRSFKDDVLYYSELIYTYIENEENIKVIEGEIVACKMIGSFVDNSFTR